MCEIKQILLKVCKLTETPWIHRGEKEEKAVASGMLSECGRRCYYNFCLHLPKWDSSQLLTSVSNGMRITRGELTALLLGKVKFCSLEVTQIKEKIQIEGIDMWKTKINNS